MSAAYGNFVGLRVFKAHVNGIPLIGPDKVPRYFSGDPEEATLQAINVYIIERGINKANLGHDKALPVDVMEVTKGSTKGTYRMLAWYESIQAMIHEDYPITLYKAISAPIDRPFS